MTSSWFLIPQVSTSIWLRNSVSHRRGVRFLRQNLPIDSSQFNITKAAYNGIPIDVKIFYSVKVPRTGLFQAQRVAVSWGSQISRQSAHEGGKVVSPTYRSPLLPLETFLVLRSVRGWVDHRTIVQPKGLIQILGKTGWKDRTFPTKTCVCLWKYLAVIIRFVIPVVLNKLPYFWIDNARVIYTKKV